VGVGRRRVEQGPRAQRGEATPEAEWQATRTFSNSDHLTEPAREASRRKAADTHCQS